MSTQANARLTGKPSPSYPLGAVVTITTPRGEPVTAPADEIVARLADFCNAVMTTDRARTFLRNIGADPFPGSPDQLVRHVARETEKWGRIVKAAGIEAE
jgi:tripartite-type tricarboxylate transporter receptor subunit TctC